ncbi:DUF2975 domain-containing protein [Butyrivibrio sp. AE3009]|uniref:DUF2975 domain-containing protein n=1 Tax=Butyrivibrio sp. AE3009 TaxID=1280666 RepID=UPI0003B533D1|nr:DUF2975 domain-containing protein [Butyrivibrio sp. AE3009]
MNKENAISKINQIGKTGRVLSIICIVCTWIGLVCAILGIIALLIIPKDLFTINLDGTAVIEVRNEDISQISAKDFEENGFASEGSWTINGDNYVPSDTTVSGDTISFSYVKEPARVTSSRIIFVLITAIVYIAVCLVLLTFVKKLCKALETTASPFEESIIFGIKRCAWALIPWAIVGGFLRSAVTSVFSSRMNSGFDFNLATVLVIVLLFGLAHIFQYGAMLQTESDETL